MSWFSRKTEGITTSTKDKKETPEGLWQKCSNCKTVFTIEDIGKNLNQIEKTTAFGLAYEVCASNFRIVPPENDLLDLIKKRWKINKADYEAIVRSVNIRYVFS